MCADEIALEISVVVIELSQQQMAITNLIFPSQNARSNSLIHLF